jgi:hypothetical protein
VSKAVWNDDALPSDPPTAFPPAFHDLHALAAQLMEAARQDPPSRAGEELEEGRDSATLTQGGDHLGATERWVEACPVSSLIASTKSIVLERERFIVAEETARRRRRSDQHQQHDDDDDDDNNDDDVQDGGVTNKKKNKEMEKKGEGSGRRGGGLLNSLNNREIKVAVHQSTAEADAEREKRREERRKEQEQRARDEEEGFQRNREELDNSRREWQLLREDREQRKRDAARQREMDKIESALSAAHQLSDASLFCASPAADPQQLLVSYYYYYYINNTY